MMQMQEGRAGTPHPRGDGQVPAAVVPWSPWADLTDSGDTRATVTGGEMLLTQQRFLQPAAALYADPDSA